MPMPEIQFNVLKVKTVVIGPKSDVLLLEKLGKNKFEFRNPKSSTKKYDLLVMKQHRTAETNQFVSARRSR